MERDDGEVRQAIHVVDAFVQERKDVLLNLLMNPLLFREPCVCRHIQCPPAAHSLAKPRKVEHSHPRKLATSKTVQRWKADGDNKERMVKALAKIFIDKIDEEKSYAGSSNRPAVFGLSQKWKKKASSFSEATKEKKSKKKRTSKKKKTSTTSSSDAAMKRKKKNKKAKEFFVRIARRVPKSTKKHKRRKGCPRSVAHPHRHRLHQRNTRRRKPPPQRRCCAQVQRMSKKTRGKHRRLRNAAVQSRVCANSC